MALYKRKQGENQNYWIRFRVAGQEIRRSAGTTDKERAEEFEQRLRNEAFDQTRLGKKPTTTWDEAVALWFNAKRRTKSQGAIEGDEQKRDWFEPYLKGIPLAQIDRAYVGKLRTVLMFEEIDTDKKTTRTRAPATINRYLAFLGGVLRYAYDNGLCDEPPVIKSIKEPESEGYALSDTEIEKLFAELALHALALAEFALETGLRYGNISNLEWRNVRLESPPQKSHLHIDAKSSKSKKPVPIPLSRRATEILKAQEGKHKTFVFVDQRGRAPVGSTKTAWLNAVKKAKLDRIRFHDLRHTWASRQIVKGVPMKIVAELGGWRSTQMLERRYAHLRRDDLAAYVD